jgi:ribosome biogenesis GTPase A
MDFYAQWIASNPGKRIFNKHLNDFIYVRFLSIQETAEHASLQFKSTKAVTYLTEILELAAIKTRTKPKPEVSNQKRFEEIVIMEYNKAGLGRLKLTVGLLRGSKQHIQYCITAIEKTTVQPARTRNS